MSKKEIDKILGERHAGEQFTVLTKEILKHHGFLDAGKCGFPLFTEMNYWVKNKVCLFYNTPHGLDTHNIYFLIGYAEMRQGLYVAVGFHWIDSEEELIQMYEAITRKKINEPILKFPHCGCAPDEVTACKSCKAITKEIRSNQIGTL